jgi:transposase
LPSQHTKESVEEIVSQEGMVIPLNLPEFRLVAQEQHADGSLSLKVIAVRDSATCPHCQQESEQIHDCRERVKRDLNVREYHVHLIVLKRRFRCRPCGRSFTEVDSACGWRRRTTVRLREAIGTQTLRQAVAHVAEDFAIGPRFARDCLRARLDPALEKRGLSQEPEHPLPTPTFLGIDEFAVRKGHRYATILCDLTSREVLEVSPGRKLEDVIPLLQRLKEPQQVKAVSMDMSASFRPAVQSCLPQAQIVVDHFHVIQHVGNAFRKVVSSWAHQKEGQILLYRKQSLFLRPHEALTDEQQRERNRIASRLPALALAWMLKEALRIWYATSTVETAEQGLDAWITLVREYGPDPMRQALSAFTHWKQEILAFFQFLPTRVSNGFVEGKNNRTKTMMRQAYGYRNFQNLRLRILVGGSL